MPLVNPYAKKKPSSVAQNPASNASAPSASGAAGPPPPPIHPPPELNLPSRRAATFSQAFDYAVDEELHIEQASAASATLAAATIDPYQPTTTTTQNNSSTATSEVFVNQHTHALYVSTRQKGNGVLNYIRNVPLCFSKMSPDFCMSTSRCAFFLSCKYHELHPDYILGRIDRLDRVYALKVLLVLVDQEDCSETLLQLNCMAVQHNLTLILSWSEEEAARYLETFKAFDGNDASIIKKREESNFVDQVANVLAECKGVNKTDSQQLLAQFGNFRSLAAASMDELGLVPGVGEVKVKRLYDAFHKPFSSRKAAERKRRKLEEEQAKLEAIAEATNEDSNDEEDAGLEAEDL